METSLFPLYALETSLLGALIISLHIFTLHDYMN